MTTEELKEMTEGDKIISIIQEAGAVSPETSISIKDIITKGIELEVTEDFPLDNYKHPWYQVIMKMMGIQGTEDEEYITLHRRLMKKPGEKDTIYYWYDPTKMHTAKCPQKYAGKKKDDLEVECHRIPTMYQGRDLTRQENECPVPVQYNGVLEPEERFYFYEMAYPGQYLFIDQKVISRDWAVKNPVKFKSLYKSWVKEHPVAYREICDQAED